MLPNLDLLFTNLIFMTFIGCLTNLTLLVRVGQFQHIRILKQISSTPNPFFVPLEIEKSGLINTCSICFNLKLFLIAKFEYRNNETGITRRSAKTCG